MRYAGVRKKWSGEDGEEVGVFPVTEDEEGDK